MTNSFFPSEPCVVSNVHQLTPKVRTLSSETRPNTCSITERNEHQSRARNRSTMTEQMFMQTLNLFFQHMDPSLLGIGDQTANANWVHYARLDQVRKITRKLVISAGQGELGPEPLQNMERFLKKPASAAQCQNSIFAGMMWKEKGNEMFKK